MGQRPFVGGGNGHTFGAVDSRTAPDGNQSITATSLVGQYRSAHRGFGRVGRRFIKYRDAQAGQGIQCFLQHARSFDALVGHDQRATDAHALALGL